MTSIVCDSVMICFVYSISGIDRQLIQLCCIPSNFAAVHKHKRLYWHARPAATATTAAAMVVIEERNTPQVAHVSVHWLRCELRARGLVVTDIDRFGHHPAKWCILGRLRFWSTTVQLFKFERCF
jgi:hypothetical protein